MKSVFNWSCGLADSRLVLDIRGRCSSRDPVRFVMVDLVARGSQVSLIAP